MNGVISFAHSARQIRALDIREPSYDRRRRRCNTRLIFEISFNQLAESTSDDALIYFFHLIIELGVQLGAGSSRTSQIRGVDERPPELPSRVLLRACWMVLPLVPPRVWEGNETHRHEWHQGGPRHYVPIQVINHFYLNLTGLILIVTEFLF